MTEFVLPEKYSEDLVDENGAKMSKRYDGMRVGDGPFIARQNDENVADRRCGWARHLLPLCKTSCPAPGVLSTVHSPSETLQFSTASSRSA